MLDKHFKCRSNDISFDIIVLIIVLVKFLDQIRIDNLQNRLLKYVAYTEVEIGVEIFKGLYDVSVFLSVPDHHLSYVGSEWSEGMDIDLVS
jgi:hypothetical protein